MRFFSYAAALAALLGCAAAPATPASANNATWAEAGDLLVRLRVIGVVPVEDDSLSIAGLDADLKDAFVPEIDFTYFFTPNIAAELILATTPHDAKTFGAANVDLGRVWLLPPTLTVQYHFTGFELVKPYVGAGVNYTIFYGVDNGAAGSVDYEDSFGVAFQAGIDVKLTEHFWFNVDVKKLILSTDVTVRGPNVTGEVDINPWIVGAGFGYRF